MIKGGLLALLSRLGGATLRREQELRPVYREEANTETTTK
jgi:hypothetical protein